MTIFGTTRTDDDHSISYRVDGDPANPALLLANSLGTTLAMWDDQIAALAQRYRVIRFDNCGHGLSGVRGRSFGIDRLAGDAIALLDHLDVERSHFCGVSLGGMIGQWIAIHAPHRINKIILANTSAHMPPPEAWDERRAKVLTDGMSHITDAVMERWFTSDFAKTSLRSAQLREDLLACPPTGYAAACAAIRDMDFRSDIDKIETETLVIGGAQDFATPPDNSQFLHDRIAGSRLAWLETAHLSNVERPGEFTRLVEEFIGSD